MDAGYEWVSHGETEPVEIDIQNTGDAPLHVTSVALAYTDGTWAFDSGCACTVPVTIAPGASAAFLADFTPTGPSYGTGTVTVLSDATNGSPATATVQLDTYGPVALSATPTSVVVPPANEDGFPGGAYATFTVVNASTGPTDMSTFWIEGPWSSALSLVPDCSMPGNCYLGFTGDQLDVTVNAEGGTGETVDFTGPIVIHSSDPAAPPVSVDLHAWIGYPKLTWDTPSGYLPGTLDLGETVWGTTVTRTLHATVTSELGVDYDVSGDPPIVTLPVGPVGLTSAAPGSTVTLVVACTPSMTDGDAGYVTLDDNEAGEEHSMYVMCTGVDAGSGGHHGGCAGTGVMFAGVFTLRSSRRRSRSGSARRP
ncbi:MAG TPA: choice-of-anchor D domain-containing protein [Kofleriaceae bacterium]